MSKQDASPLAMAMFRALDRGDLIEFSRLRDMTSLPKDDPVLRKSCDFHLAPEDREMTKDDSQLTRARAQLRKQLDWRGPNGKAQGIVTLTRDEAEAILAGPTEPVAVLDEIGRLSLLVKKDEVEAYAEAGGMKRPGGS